MAKQWQRQRDWYKGGAESDGILTFVMYALAIFLFFGLHNLMQEAIMTFQGFNYGLMLGYLEVLGVTVFTHIERKYTPGDGEGGEGGTVVGGGGGGNKNSNKRVAPLRSYALLTFLLMSSSSLSNLSLNYINYPTKVVFRSCKLIPTMFLATVLNGRTFSFVEYFAAGAICLGLVVYSFSESQESAKFSPFGMILVSLSVIADSALPNAQERLFRMGCSRSEVTYYTNVLVLAGMTITTVASGDLKVTLTFSVMNPGIVPYLAFYTVISYLAITVHMSTIKKFSAVPTVLLGTARKALTIVVSFVVFPKPMGFGHLTGTVMVLGGLTASGLGKAKNKKAGNVGMVKRGRGASGGV